MADELVRIKVEDQSSTGLAGALLRIFDGNDVLKAEGLTSSGPSPALGVFQTVLPGSATPGTLYTIHVKHDQTKFNSGRSQIRVIT